MPIKSEGWELLIKRLGIHKSGSKTRTYAEYQVFRDGNAVSGLGGFICECPGPGDNDEAGNKLRIEKGRYPLWTQFGRYRTIDYSDDTETQGLDPMPALLLRGTGNRVGILIHPAHPPKLYLSSVGCLNPSGPLRSAQSINFWDSRARVIALINDLQGYAPLAFEHKVSTRIPNATVVIDGEPTNVLADPPSAMAAMRAAAPSEPDSLPISREGAVACARWLTSNFGPKLRAAANAKPYAVKHLCAIVCQETAYKWLKWTRTYDPATILARCVFDASGDYPGTSRDAFPKNTAAFRRKYGDAFTSMLIQEANTTRRMQGYGDKSWVYKGYGIFQYDLQHIERDEAFFRNKEWYSFDACLAKCCNELDEKLASSRNDLWTAIRKYNGAGAAAQRYLENVKIFTEYCAEVTG